MVLPSNPFNQLERLSNVLRSLPQSAKGSEKTIVETFLKKIERAREPTRTEKKIGITSSQGINTPSESAASLQRMWDEAMGIPKKTLQQREVLKEFQREMAIIGNPFHLVFEHPPGGSAEASIEGKSRAVTLRQSPEAKQPLPPKTKSEKEIFQEQKKGMITQLEKARIPRGMKDFGNVLAAPFGVFALGSWALLTIGLPLCALSVVVGLCSLPIVGMYFLVDALQRRSLRAALNRIDTSEQLVPLWKRLSANDRSSCLQNFGHEFQAKIVTSYGQLYLELFHENDDLCSKDQLTLLQNLGPTFRLEVGKKFSKFKKLCEAVDTFENKDSSRELRVTAWQSLRSKELVSFAEVFFDAYRSSLPVKKSGSN